MRIVCVDFNGVLDGYQGWRGAGHFDDPRPGAREFLEGLQTRGYRVVVFTARYAPDVWQWLREHGLSDLVTDVTDRKLAAHVFVDDRAVCFRGDAPRDRALRRALGRRSGYADAADAAGTSSSMSLKQSRA